MVDDFNYHNYYSKKLKSNSPTNKKLATAALEYTSSPRNNLMVRNKKKLKPISTNINYIPGMC